MRLLGHTTRNVESMSGAGGGGNLVFDVNNFEFVNVNSTWTSRKTKQTASAVGHCGDDARRVGRGDGHEQRHVARVQSERGRQLWDGYHLAVAHVLGQQQRFEVQFLQPILEVHQALENVTKCLTVDLKVRQQRTGGGGGEEIGSEMHLRNQETSSAWKPAAPIRSCWKWVAKSWRTSSCLCSFCCSTRCARSWKKFKAR